MDYYRIAWCIKKENKYCFGNWQPDKKLESLNIKLEKLLPIINSQNKEFLVFEKKYIKEKDAKSLLIKKIEQEREIFNQLYISLNNMKNKIKMIEIEEQGLSKHLSDLNKFKYDKDCKYCIKNGSKQINEKKDIKNSD